MTDPLDLRQLSHDEKDRLIRFLDGNNRNVMGIIQDMLSHFEAVAKSDDEPAAKFDLGEAIVSAMAIRINETSATAAAHRDRVISGEPHRPN